MFLSSFPSTHTHSFICIYKWLVYRNCTVFFVYVSALVCWMYLSYFKVYLYFYWVSDCTTWWERERAHTHHIKFHDQMVSINRLFVSGYIMYMYGTTVIAEKKKQFISSKYGGQNKLGMHTCASYLFSFEQLSDKTLINMRTKCVSFLYERIYFHFQWLQFLSWAFVCVCVSWAIIFRFFETCVRIFYQRHGITSLFERRFSMLVWLIL